MKKTGKKLLALLLTLAVVLTLFAGCSGGTGSSTAGGTGTSTGETGNTSTGETSAAEGGTSGEESSGGVHPVP